jgi:signal transduction histidine kinase
MVTKLLPKNKNTDTEGNKILYRLNNRYIKQALLVGTAIVLGIFVTHLLLRQILVREALAQEAEYFWGVVNRDSLAPLPATKNIRVYLLPRDGHLLPQAAHKLHLGYHDYQYMDGFNVAYLTQNNSNKKLLILFNRSGVDSLVLLFGIVPLAIALIFLYGSLFFSYRYSKRLLSPAILLADKVKQTDLFNIDKDYFSSANTLFENDDEVKSIAAAIGELSLRLEQFVERERSFTRDVSHELRSSITVVKMASELLIYKKLGSDENKLIDKISKASKDMEELTEFFLILAREESLLTTQNSVSLRAVVDKEVEKLTLLTKEKNIPVFNQQNDDCYINVSEKVLSVLVGNLLRNAVLYTDTGRIDVMVNGNELIVSDTGVGISEDKMKTILDCFSRDNADQKGFGIGLSIVKRLCDRFSWELLIKSEKNVGTAVRVEFFKRGLDEL